MRVLATVSDVLFLAPKWLQYNLRLRFIYAILLGHAIHRMATTAGPEAQASSGWKMSRPFNLASQRRGAERKACRE